MNDSDSDDLSTKLRAWKVDPKSSQTFQREVWQRIAARQTTREEAFWPGLARWFASQFARPQYAMALLAVGLSTGLGVAHLQAKDTNARLGKQMEMRYAASVDPLAKMAR